MLELVCLLYLVHKFVCYLLCYSLSEEDEDPDGEWIRNTVSLGGDENDKVNALINYP